MLQMMSIAEYSESRNVPDSMLRRLISEGKIAAGKVGKRWLLNAAKVDEYFEELTTPKCPIPRYRGSTEERLKMMMQRAKEKARMNAAR